MISKLTIAYAIFLVLFSTVARKIFDQFLMLFGRPTLIILVWIAFVVAALIVFRAATQLDLRRLFAIGVIISIGILYALTFDRFEERLHLLKYGLLGWILYRDVERTKSPEGPKYNLLKWFNLFGHYRVIPAVMVGILIVSSTDELVQHFTPGRVGDVRDIVFDVVGGVWGALIYRLTDHN